MQQRIVQCRADLHGTLSRNNTPVRIDKSKRPNEGVQGADFGGSQPGFGCASGLCLVSLRTFSHRAKAVVSVPNGLKNFNFQLGAIWRVNFRDESKCVFE